MKKRRMKETKKLGNFYIETEVYMDIDLPLCDFIASLTMKPSHTRAMVDLILNGNRCPIFHVPIWLFERVWLPIDIDTMRYHTVVLRIYNKSSIDRLNVEVWYVRDERRSRDS